MDGRQREFRLFEQPQLSLDSAGTVAFAAQPQNRRPILIRQFCDSGCDEDVCLPIGMRIPHVTSPHAAGSSILGLTIDYGPYGWIDNFDLDWLRLVIERAAKGASVAASRLKGR